MLTLLRVAPEGDHVDKLQINIRLIRRTNDDDEDCLELDAFICD